MSVSPKKFIVLYKSGNRFEFTAEDIDLSWSTIDGHVTRFGWTKAEPEPMMAGLPNIEAVWRIK